MLSTRLQIALDRGLVTLPGDGTIGVFGARAADDLSLLPKNRVQVVSRFYPDHAALKEAGYDVRTSPEGPFATSLVLLPRARAEGEARIAVACALTEGPVIVDGAKTDGADAVLRAARQRGEVSEAISKAHGKLFVITGGDFSDWAEGRAQSVPGGFLVPAGAFSADGIDKGSAALAEALPAKLGKQVVDLGAGWGYLATQILTRESVERVDLVEADHSALAAAKENVSDPRAHFHWADARSWRPEAPVDAVVTNPPFHVGRESDPALGQAFLTAAAQMLKPTGTLWLVANRHLPYERVLRDAFAEVRDLGGPGGFKLCAATRPKRDKNRKG